MFIYHSNLQFKSGIAVYGGNVADYFMMINWVKQGYVPKPNVFQVIVSFL